MQHYILVDSQGFVSQFIRTSLQEAKEHAYGLIVEECFSDVDWIDVYEVDTRAKEVNAIVRICRDEAEKAL